MVTYKGWIKEKMRKDPITIGPDGTFYEARAIVRDKGIRHLPVVDKNRRLIGLVTDRDIREASPSDATTLSVHELHYLLGKLKVSGIMTPKDKLVTITSDILIEEAVQLMHDHKIGCLPVLEEGKLSGLITETDVLDMLVDVFGLKIPGTRVTLALEDKPGAMFKAVEIIKNHNINIISIVSPSFMVDGKRIAAIRLQTHDFEPIVKELQKAGYEILTTGKWAG